MALRRRFAVERGHGEVTLREIYDALAGDVRFELCRAAPDQLSWEAEWLLEKQLVKAHPIGLDLLNHALAGGLVQAAAAGRHLSASSSKRRGARNRLQQHYEFAVGDPADG